MHKDAILMIFNFSTAGIYGSGVDGNSGVIAENVNKLSSSSLGTSSGIAETSKSATVGVVSKKKSSKNSSSESNKGTKTKTGTNFQTVNQNVAASTYDASKSNRNWKYIFKSIQINDSRINNVLNRLRTQLWS